MSLKKVLGCAAAMILSAVAGAADVLYVACDDPNASDEAGEGRGTEALPYATIQAAVAAAQEDSVVRVKPGVYSNGVAKSVNGNVNQDNRVLLTKRLRLVSTEGAAKTVILGKWGDADVAAPGAIRCVYVDEAAAGSSVEGFTLANGSTRNDSKSTDRGGAFYAPAGGYLVDCAVTNCAGYSASAMFGGTAVRCLVRDCFAKGWDGGLVKNAACWNCVIVHSRGSWTTYDGEFALFNVTNVNCTFVSDSFAKFREGCKSYNFLCAYFNRNVETFTDDCETYASVTTGGSPAAARHCVNPFFGDFRLLSTSSAIGKGDAQYLESIIELPSWIARKDFTGNDLTGLSGAVAAGASQSAVTPEYGGFFLTDGTASYVNGAYVPALGYVFAETWPVVWRFSSTHARPLFYERVCNDGSGTRVNVYPVPDGSFYLVPPPTPGQLDQLWMCGAGDVLWVDGAEGDDETGTGAEDAPFATVNAAVRASNAAKADGGNSLVKVRKGVYATGGEEVDGVKWRVNAKLAGGSSRLSVVAVDGPGETVLAGPTDDEPSTAWVRGLAGQVSFQGFTMTSLRTDATDENLPATGFYGTILHDCTVTNCAATGLLVDGGAGLYRTRFLGNRSVSDVLYRGQSPLAFCAFFGNACGSGLISGAANPHMVNCSFAGNVAASGPISSDYVFADNCLFDNNGQSFHSGDSGRATPSYLWNAVVDGTLPANMTLRDPEFADAATGDLRLARTSPALSGGAFTCEKSPTVYRYLAADINGRPAVVLSGGATVMGCDQYDFVNAAKVSASLGGLAVTGARIGLNAVEPGSSLTFTVARGGGSPRNVAGVVANGATYLFADAASYSFTVDDAHPVLKVEAFYSPDWYVDAVNGNDANDGFTPGTAKKTLAEAVTNTALTAGDVIHALPGTYEEGFQMHPSDIYTKTRVIVPAGVSLISTEGKDVTVIRGENAPEPIKSGCGFGATRCVCLGAGARLEGFTLSGGRTVAAWDGSYASDFYGAAVKAPDRTATVVDCLISDCKGGLAAQFGSYFRCRVDASWMDSGTTFNQSFLASCVVNRGSVKDCDLVNCTVRPSYGYPSLDHDGGTPKTSSAYNTVFYGPGTSVNATYGSCMCVTNVSEHNLWGKCMVPGAAGTETILFTNSEAIALTDYRPATADHPFVDAGDNALLPSGDDASLDIAGAPRAMNRRVDLGAYEWDIRPDLSADLGRKATVDFVTANVVENGGTVLLDGDGARLEATLAARAGQPRGQAVTVTGTGVLKVYLNGTLVAEKGAGMWDLDFGKLAASNALVYVVEGDATAEFAGTKSREGLLLLFR